MACGERVDSIHFAWGLQDYDLVRYRPHFLAIRCIWPVAG